MLGKEVQGDFSPTYPRQPHLGGIYSPVISLKTIGFTTKYAFTSHFGTEMLGKEVQGDFSPTYPQKPHLGGIYSPIISLKTLALKAKAEACPHSAPTQIKGYVEVLRG